MSTRSLALATTGPAPYRAGDVLCLVDGVLDDLPELAGAAGIAPGAGPEAVLAAAWGRQGTAILPRLRGDFAAVLWDERTRTGALLRDQLGGRAVIWARRGARLLFASEVHHLLPLLERRPGPDRVALLHWIAVSGQPGERTLFEGVSKLPAGHAMMLEDGGARLHRYWPGPGGARLRASRADAVGALRTAIDRAVARRVDAERPTALMLSGGLDSTAVAASARGQGADVMACSAVFPAHPDIDESRLIGTVAAALDLDGIALEVRGGSVIGGALDHLRRWDVPPVSPNEFFWGPLLRRAAARGARVLLDGEGGDELFANQPYLLADRLRRGRVVSALALARRAPTGGDPLPWRRVARYAGHFGVRGALPYGLHTRLRARRDPAAFAPPWLGAAEARLLLETGEEWAWKRDPRPRWQANLLARAAISMGPGLTRDNARRRADAAGLAVRHPLLDVDLVELLARLPPELAFDRRLSRPLLRDAMAGRLPDAVRLRPDKSYFDALFHESLATTDLPLVRQLLGDPGAEVGAYVDLGAVRRHLLARVPDSALEPWALLVWRLAGAECWLRREADPAFAPPVASPSVQEVPFSALRPARDPRQSVVSSPHPTEG